MCVSMVREGLIQHVHWNYSSEGIKGDQSKAK
jgi:hypothetical protein